MKVFSNSSVCRVPDDSLIVGGQACHYLVCRGVSPRPHPGTSTPACSTTTCICKSLVPVHSQSLKTQAPRQKHTGLHTGMQHDNVHLQIPSTSPQPVFEDSIVARP